jgi:hypothetical protein
MAEAVVSNTTITAARSGRKGTRTGPMVPVVESTAIASRRRVRLRHRRNFDYQNSRY